MRTIFFWILLFPGYVLSQENTPAPTLERLPFTLKTAPINLLNPYQISLDVLADFPIATRWAIEMGVGFVLDSKHFARYQGETYHGIKLKPTLKYYFNRSSGGDDYFGLSFKYNSLRNDRFVRLIRQGGQYFENLLQPRTVETWGVSVRYGGQQYMGKRKRLFFEPYFAFGIRQSYVLYDEIPVDAELIPDRGWFDLSRTPGVTTTPDFMMGINLGWRFARRR